MPKKPLYAIVAITAVLLSSCSLLPVEETLPEIPIIREYEKGTVEQVKVQRGDLILSSDVRCTYEITKQEELGFALGGVYIDQVYVTEGDSVKAGDVLISLEMEAIEQNIASMQHALSKLYLQREQLIEKRDLEYTRIDLVLGDIASELSALEVFIGSVPEETTAPTEETIAQTTEAVTTPSKEEEWKAAKVKYEELLKEQANQQEERESVRADYEERVRDVDDSIYLQKLRISEKNADADERRLVANIDGTVTYVRDIGEGQRTVKGQYLVIISDWESAYILVKGDYAADLPVGKEITVSMGSDQLQAVVIDPAQNGIETEEGVKASYLKLLQPDPTLTDGKAGTIHIVKDQRNDVLYVDDDAIVTSNGETYVYMLDENGLRVVQKVKTGFACDNYIEILEGLEEGDLVIID